MRSHRHKAVASTRRRRRRSQGIGSTGRARSSAGSSGLPGRRLTGRHRRPNWWRLGGRGHRPPPSRHTPPPGRNQRGHRFPRRTRRTRSSCLPSGRTGRGHRRPCRRTAGSSPGRCKRLRGSRWHCRRRTRHHKAWSRRDRHRLRWCRSCSRGTPSRHSGTRPCSSGSGRCWRGRIHRQRWSRSVRNRPHPCPWAGKRWHCNTRRRSRSSSCRSERIESRHRPATGRPRGQPGHTGRPPRSATGRCDCPRCSSRADRRPWRSGRRTRRCPDRKRSPRTRHPGHRPSRSTTRRGKSRRRRPRSRRGRIRLCTARQPPSRGRPPTRSTCRRRSPRTASTAWSRHPSPHHSRMRPPTALCQPTTKRQPKSSSWVALPGIALLRTIGRSAQC